jgi:hypothetical protein
MFLIERRATGSQLRVDLAPPQLFGSAGDLVRAALVARSPVTGPTAPHARRLTVQLDLGLPMPARRRMAG